MDPIVPSLRATDEAALALHQIGTDPAAICQLLERLVIDLGLATEALFVHEVLLEEVPAERDGDEHPVPVCRPDGTREGTLRCRPTSARALARIRSLAAHAGVALAKAELTRQVAQREEALRRIAERLQDALLPPLPDLHETLLAVRYRAAGREARVGGDFYDVFPLPNGWVLLVVGDVVGKGVEAAGRTSRITQTLRALALQGQDLSELLARADEQVTYQDPEVMATVWCGLYEPATGELRFASLGHPPALLIRAEGEPVRLELEGLPLGLRDLSESEPEIRSRLLEPRDLLVLYTDGLVEAHRDFITGQQALLSAIETRRDLPLAQLIDDAVDELLADAGHTDDAVMLLLRRR